MGASTQAFLIGNENKALMYMNEADKTLTGAAKMHLDAAISALQSGDSNMAKKHLGEIEYACGIPDIFWWKQETYDYIDYIYKNYAKYGELLLLLLLMTLINPALSWLRMTYNV